MKSHYLPAALVALATVLNLSGCIVARDEHYRYDHGDRIASDGRRDVGWCDVHTNDVHCRTVAR